MYYFLWKVGCAYIVELLFRLYPVIPANARVIAEKDILVGGYLIPKNVSTDV